MAAWSECRPRPPWSHSHTHCALRWPASSWEQPPPSHQPVSYASLLFATSPWDVTTYAGVMLSLIAVALISGYLPAQKSFWYRPNDSFAKPVNAGFHGCSSDVATKPLSYSEHGRSIPCRSKTMSS